MSIAPFFSMATWVVASGTCSPVNSVTCGTLRQCSVTAWIVQRSPGMQTPWRYGPVPTWWARAHSNPICSTVVTLDGPRAALRQPNCEIGRQ